MTQIQVDLFKELCKPSHYIRLIEDLRSDTQNAPWERYRETRASKLTLDQFLLRAEGFVKEITKEIQKKRYRPQPVHISYVKTDTKVRTIYQLHLIDKIIQSVCARILAQKFDLIWCDELYSFRKGRNNKMLISKFSRYLEKEPTCTLYKTDIKSYGESISQRELIKVFKEVLGRQDAYIMELLQTFIVPTVIDENERTFPLPEGIATGTPLVPIIENLYLHSLDKLFSKQECLFYGRYGDDILLCHPNADVVTKKKRLLERHIKELGLLPSPSKTIFGVFGTDFHYLEYLGLLFHRNGKVSLPNKKLQRLKRCISAVCKQSYQSIRRLERDKAKIIKHLIHNVNMFLQRYDFIPYLDYLSMDEYDLGRCKQLDKWVAKQILSQVYHTAHDRVFRFYPLKKLRRNGLISIQNIRQRRIRKRAYVA